MGYRVKKLPNKKSDSKWKVQYVSYKKDIENFDQTNPRKTWDVNKDRWKPLGFYKYMTFVEAKLKRFDSILPEEFTNEFEKRFVTDWMYSVDGGD